MRVKSVTLYSLPYIVSVASLVVAAHQVTPSLQTAPGLQSNVSGKTELISGQVVNRALKSDRLPIKQAAPQVNDKVPAKVPLKSTTACAPPGSADWVCVADARKRKNVAAVAAA